MSYLDDETTDITLVDIRRAAMNIMAAREHSVLELQQKLLKKGMPSERVDEALWQLQQDNLLNDERFAEMFVRSRFHRGQGPMKIRYELVGRGVDEQLINLSLAEYEQEWLPLAQSLREKKFGSELPVDLKEKARQARFLTQRGFNADQVRRALDE